MNRIFKRGMVYFAKLDGAIGSEQGGCRPVVIVQNDTGNKYSPTVIVAAITSKQHKAKLPTHVELSAREDKDFVDSVALMEQLRTIDKSRLKEFKFSLSDDEMNRVNDALLISIGLN